MSQSFDDLRKFLNRRLKGKFITSLLESISSGDELNRENILAVKENLFITTASGIFLDKLLARLGITRPPGVGIDDDLIRQIAIKQTNNKLVNNIILEVLEIFYGADAIQANVLSGLPEKYILADGMTLVLKMDTNTNPLTIIFKSEDFNNISLATAQEVANAISNSSFNQGYTLTASVELNNDNGLNYVQLFSGTKGAKSSITIIGGEAQNILKFPEQKLAIAKLGTQFTTSFNGPYVRFTWTAGPDPGLNFVDVSDYANIYGSGYLSANRGSFTIENVQGGAVGTAFFEIINPLFKPQSPVILSGVDSTSGGGTISRELSIADSPTGAIRASNTVTITTTNPHALSSGQSVRIANVFNSSFNGTFTILITGLSTFTYVQNGPDTISGSGSVFHESTIVSPTTGAVRSAGVATITTTSAHGYSAGQTVSILGIEDSSFDGLYSITTVSTNSFTYSQDFSYDITFFKPLRSTIQSMPRYASVYEVNPYEIIIFIPATTRIVKRDLIGSWHVHGTNIDTTFLGSYTYDESQLPISRVSTTLNIEIDQGSLETVIFGLDTSQFPDQEGFLMFNFGNEKQEGPVKYYGRPSTGSLLIDPSYKFKNTHDVGADVILLLDRKGYKPRQDGSDYQPYVTSTVVGRLEAEKMIDRLKASGIFVNLFIVYPKHPGLVNIQDWIYAGDS
jgi:hypothetical protein